MITVRLAAYGDDSRRYPLAGDPLKEQREFSGISGARTQHQRSIQEVGGAGWDHASFQDRANERSSRSFSTTRLFADTKEAWQWMNSFARLDETEWPHPLVGDIYERYTLADGSWVEECFHGAVMQKPVMTFNGRTVSLNYSFNFEYTTEGNSGSTVFLVALNEAAEEVYLFDANDTFLIADFIA